VDEVWSWVLVRAEDRGCAASAQHSTEALQGLRLSRECLIGSEHHNSVLIV
jgi:hypothetical protein